MSQRYFLVFYNYPNSFTGSSPYDTSPYDVYRLKAKKLPAMARIQGEIIQDLGDKLRGSAYHVRITGITEVTQEEFDDFTRVDSDDEMQEAIQHPPVQPSDCVLL